MLRTTQSQSIADKGSGKSKVWRGHAYFICFPARKSGDAEGVAEAKTLIDLGVHIGFQPIPHPPTGVECQIVCLGATVAREEAIGPVKWRGEWGMILSYISELRMKGEVFESAPF